MPAITIYSKSADHPEWRIAREGLSTHPTWTGWVDDADLDVIFRQFNRVDPEDGNRLEDMGYTLPSLSSGDIVTTPAGHFFCARVGWVQINEEEVATIKRTPQHSRMWRLIESSLA